MINLFNGLLTNVGGLIQTAIGVAAAAYVAGIWWRTKALVPTLAAVVLAAVVVWAAANVSFLQGQVDQTTREVLDGVLVTPTLLAVRRRSAAAGRPGGRTAPPRGPRRPHPVRPARGGAA